MPSDSLLNRLNQVSQCSNAELLQHCEVRRLFWKHAKRFRGEAEEIQSRAFILWLEMPNVRDSNAKCFGKYLSSCIRHCVTKAQVYRKRRKRCLPTTSFCYSEEGIMVEPRGKPAGVFFAPEEVQHLRGAIRARVKRTDPEFLVKVLDCMLGSNDAKEFSKQNGVHYNKFHAGKSTIRRLFERVAA